jgi:DNA-directed RNA polymerase alpha subunit
MTHDDATPPASAWPKGVGAPARRALANAGFDHLDQLSRTTERELAALHGMGPKALRILGEALAERGLAFGLAFKDAGTG